MRKIFVLLIMLLLASSFVYSQTYEQIQKEANPEYTYVQDNSEQAQLLRTLTMAKKSGNMELFNSTLNELNTKFSGNGTISQSTPLPENRNVFLPVDRFNPGEITSPDWANGENRIYGFNVGTSSVGNPNVHNRMLKIETDTIGNLFAGFLNGAKDTLFFYKSTNKGSSWSMIKALYAGASMYYYSFDFAVGDVTGGFNIGMVVSIAPTATPYGGTIYFGNMMSDGSSFTPTTVDTPTSGRGLIGPVICTDAYIWNPGSTYWYIAYQNCDATTGVTSFVPAVYTPNLGSTWVRDTARSTFNDYELDIDYDFASDSIYVLLTNNLTTSNENLRLRYLALSNWGTNVSWKQFNPASTSLPEYNGCLAVNRKNYDMVVTYTVTNGSDKDVRYSYSVGGLNPGWVTDNILSAQTNAESRSFIQSNPQQNGSFRVVFVSENTSFDTVIYMNTFSIAGGFAARTVVSKVNASTGVLTPCVTGYTFSGIAGAGAIYAGSGPSKIWYNGSDITTESRNITTLTPEKYDLLQNYPNPFNPTTKISFSIPKSESVSIKIYNTVGKEITELVNNYYNAGTYEVIFDASKLSSGIYFYKITAGNFTDTKKMVLIK